MLESTPPEATGIRAIAFHPDGRHLFSALQDGLRVWQWEPPPAFQHDNVDVPWSKVSTRLGRGMLHAPTAVVLAARGCMPHVDLGRLSPDLDMCLNPPGIRHHAHA